MGRTNEINTKIGTANFSSHATVNESELIKESCTLFSNTFTFLSNLIDIKTITCSLK